MWHNYYTTTGESEKFMLVRMFLLLLSHIHTCTLISTTYQMVLAYYFLYL